MVSCYTCDRVMRWKTAQAGHFVGGRSSAVLLNEEVIRPQCIKCNVMLRGNYQIFTLRMVAEVGIKKVEELLDLKGRVVKFSRADLEEKIQAYRDRLRRLEGGA